MELPNMSFSWTSTSGAVILFVALGGSHLAWSQVDHLASQAGTKEHPRVVLSHALPKLDGSHVKATIVEVTYGPGESSPPHTHPCAVIGYILEGTLRTQVEGEPEAIYKSGESFYESPNGVHMISANASQTKSAKFLAYFVCDHDAPLSSDLPKIGKSKGTQ
jgi:quercetin dioxygenase-like cupin family protein